LEGKNLVNQGVLLLHVNATKSRISKLKLNTFQKKRKRKKGTLLLGGVNRSHVYVPTRQLLREKILGKNKSEKNFNN
jgi:hypothetical protein